MTVRPELGSPASGVSRPRSPDKSVQDLHIAGFEVMAELGRGAESRVFRVRRADAREDAPEYALKILNAAPSGPGGAAAFRREAALLASIDHPGMPVIHDVGEFRQRPFLVMDLIDGVPLTGLLAANPLAAEVVIRVALDVLGPLTAAHARGLVHHDLKPDNIIVLPGGEAKLIDFGMATRTSTDRAAAAVGTLAYAAPEQSGTLKRPVDNRSDLYSLGVVLFECLTGVLPFATTDVGDLLRMHTVTPAPDLNELVPDLLPGLAAVVAALLAKDPDDRYQSGAQLAADLRGLQGVRSPPSRPLVSGVGPESHEPLRGRARELTLLLGRWQAVLKGPGRACVIRAGGGGGKSHLAAELAAVVGESGLLALPGKCSADDPVPLGPLRAGIEALLASAERLESADRELVYDRIRAAMGSGSTLLGSLTPSLAALLGDSGEPAGSPTQDQFTTAVVGLFTGLAQQWGGLLLVVDDIQWLDPGSARVLSQLCGQLDGVPLMLLVTGRNDPDSGADTDAVIAAWGEAVDLDLDLAPMDQEAASELVRALLPGMVDNTSLAQLLRVRGDGNPFVMIEYLRAIVDAGLLRPSWGTWVLDDAALDALKLPQDALGLVAARVRSLGSQVRDLLVTAAAIGTRFSPGLVAAVHDESVEAVLQAMVEAAAHSLVESRGPDEFTFLHDRIREALHEELDAEGTSDLHRRIAEALIALAPPDGGHHSEHVYAVAHHSMRTGPNGDPGAVFAACWEAGTMALAGHAVEDAVTFLEHAATIHGAMRDAMTESRFLLDLGCALKEHDQYDEAHACLEQALALESRPLARGRLFSLLADVHKSRWDPIGAAQAVEHGFAELGAPLPRNRFMLTASTVAMFAAATFMQWTGRGFGSAGGDERVRCALIAGMHEVGAHNGVVGAKPLQMILHTLRARYWVTRIGEGPQYARSQGVIGFLWGQLGLRRLSRRAFARAATDPSMSDPSMRALIAFYEGATTYLGYQDNGADWARVIEEHGQWLDLAEYCDALTALIGEALNRGNIPEAEHLLELGQRRSALRASKLASIVLAEPTILAARGLAHDATTAMGRVKQQLTDNNALSITIWQCVSQILVLHEQNETGPAFDEVAAAFEALAIPPAFMVRPQRLVYFQVAVGRLTQCRAAGESEFPARLRDARAAVKVLRQACKSDDLRARERIARADLLILEGRSTAALTLLAALDPLHHPDAPLLSYETARVRARAYSALEEVDEAHRQAKFAFMIAQESGWPHRCAWITTEFGPVNVSPSPSGNGALSFSRKGDGRASASELVSGGSMNSPGGARGTASIIQAGVDRKRLLALEQVSAAASRVVDPAVLARIALDETIRILSAGRAFLFLADENDRLVPHLGRDAAGQDVTELTGYSASLVERVHHTREPLVVTGTDEGAALGAQSVVLHGLRSIMVAPLQLEGRLLGVVYLDSQVATGIFDANDAGILTALTNHIATSLETARAAQLAISVQAAQRQRDLAETLRAALEAITRLLTPQDVLNELLTWALTVGSGDAAWLLAFEGDQLTLTEHTKDGLLKSPLSSVDPAMSRLMDADRPIVGSAEAIPAALRERLKRASSWMCLPLRSGNTSLGLFVLVAYTPGAIVETELEVASTLVAQGITAYERATLLAQIQTHAVSDELTGIPNRRHFFDVAHRDVATALRGGHALAVMMIDIDLFKAVNDTHGHPTGDDVIRVVAQRLASLIRREGDLIGRYGGEEFAVVLPNTSSDDELPERMRAAIADEPVPTRTGPLRITVSIGLTQLTQLTPTDTDIDGLLARADKALYTAKQDGRNCIRIA